MQGKEDYDPNLDCPICLQLAKNAVQSECCGHLFCENCVGKLNEKFKQCPCCKNPNLKVKQSKIARRMISGIKIDCPNGCQLKVQYGDLNTHLSKCSLQLIACIFCKEKYRRKDIVQHTIHEHRSQTEKAVIQLHTKKEDSHDVQVHIYSDARQNRNGAMSNLGETGKYYCGGQLKGVCNCCNGYCGKTNGQNCDACMELDVNRLHLTKGYLINPKGYICQFNKQHNNFTCGRSSEIKGIFGSTRNTCKGGNQCNDCQSITNSIRIGRYKDLI